LHIPHVENSVGSVENPAFPFSMRPSIHFSRLIFQFYVNRMSTIDIFPACAIDLE